MSPLNRGPLLGPRVPPSGIRPLPPSRFGGRLPPPGLPPRMPPPPMSPVFGPMRQRLPPPPRPGGVSRPNGPLPLFAPRVRGMAPMVPPMGLRGTGPRGPLMRPWPRRVPPPQLMSHMRPRFSIGNGNVKGKPMNNVKKVNKLEELELKKPWMTDEIRSEIQKKNKLYAKAKKNKDAKEWEEFKDLRNKVTRMIRDAKNDYLTKHPEQAHLYQCDDEPYDQRDENHVSSEDDQSYYCEVCDRDFPSEDSLFEHKKEHKLCGIDGCTFSAHPLLVERHISMQHSSGLYHRMKNLSTPEDIEKWLLERKKRYPTKANIELRKAEELEKVERGEVIKQKQDSVKRRKKKSSNARSRKRTAHKYSNQEFNKVLDQTKEMYRGLQSFPGIFNLPKRELENEHSDAEVIEEVPEEVVNHISDEEDIICTPSKSIITNPRVPSLVADYGSDSDEDKPEEIPIKKLKVSDDKNSNTDNITPAEEKIVDTNNRSDTCKNLHNNSERQSSTKVTSVDSKYQKVQGRELNRHSRSKDSRMTPNKRQNNRLQLLQRLLARSIQHERNLICQCIKYIVDNKFFD